MPPNKTEKISGLDGGKFILPADPKGFQDPKYWDQFFASRKAAFEWYGNFMDSAGILCKYIKSKDDILVIGSGNSELSAQMYHIGLKKITNVDISQVVVDKMTKKYAEQCPDMRFVKDDVTKLETIVDESFSVVLDKATFDALVADESVDSAELAFKICDEVDRVLKFGGRYICITLAQKHVLGPLIINMANKGYAIRAHVIDIESNQAEQTNEVIFCFIFTKMKPGGPLICDLQLSSSEKLTRVEDLHQFLKRIQDFQTVNCITKCLRYGKYDVVEGEHLKIFSSDRQTHLYNLYPFKPNVKKPQFMSACFIIPPGRSKTYLYATHEGRKQVAEDNISASLVMFAEVMPAAGASFSFNAVKDELTPHLKKLMPLKLFEKMIFMTDGAFPESEVLVPGDEIIFEGTSTTTGEYRIYERRLPGPDEFERRLVFLDQPHVTQTEIHLKKDFDIDSCPGNHLESISFNYGYLPSDYQRAVIAVLLNHPKLSCPEPQNVCVLLVGLGGGALASFIHHNFPTATVEAVELDPVMVDIAIRFFGLPVDERCSCHVHEGLAFLLNAARRGNKYDILIIDADTKDPSLPLRCPPAEFVSPENIEIMMHLTNPSGMVIVNVVSRLAAVTDAIKSEMLNVFGNVLYSPAQNDDLNSVVVALHKDYFVSKTDAVTDNHIQARTKSAFGGWLQNIRKFNQMMDEKFDEILIDGDVPHKRNLFSNVNMVLLSPSSHSRAQIFMKFITGGRVYMVAESGGQFLNSVYVGMWDNQYG